jgi:hypothetical protein
MAAPVPSGNAWPDLPAAPLPVRLSIDVEVRQGDETCRMLVAVPSHLRRLTALRSGQPGD